MLCHVRTPEAVLICPICYQTCCLCVCVGCISFETAKWVWLKFCTMMEVCHRNGIAFWSATGTKHVVFLCQQCLCLADTCINSYWFARWQRSCINTVVLMQLILTACLVQLRLTTTHPWVNSGQSG